MNTDIRIAVSFKNHRKRKRLRMLLGAGSTDYLLDLWIATAMNHPNGILEGMDALDVALEAGWEEEPERFVNVLIECGFLERDVRGVYFLHDWEEHQGYVVHAGARAARAKAGAAAKWGTAPAEQSAKKTRSERLTQARSKGTHTDEGWGVMREFFEERCVRCGSADVEIVKDHIVPIYQGGCDSIHNLQPMCRKCNAAKGPENIDYRRSSADFLGKEMPAEFLPDACDKQALNVCECLLTSAKTPAPSPSPAPSPDPVPEPEPENLKHGAEEPPPSASAFQGKSTAVQEKSPLTLEGLQAAWNMVMVPQGFPGMREINAARQRHFRARVAENPERATGGYWCQAFRKINASDFLSGRIDPPPGRKRFIASLPWFLERADALSKLMEGFYDNDKTGEWEEDLEP